MKQEYDIYKRRFERTLPATPTGIHFAIKFFGSSAEFVGAVDGLNNKAKQNHPATPEKIMQML